MKMTQKMRTISKIKLNPEMKMHTKKKMTSIEKMFQLAFWTMRVIHANYEWYIQYSQKLQARGQLMGRSVTQGPPEL